MKDIVNIFGESMEYDFLSGWIKYNRLKKEYSQEALAYGICSTSHLSYFENGKKRLRGEIVEELLKKLGISSIVGVKEIGQVRQNLNKMAFLIESYDYETSTDIYNKLLSMEPILHSSPYIIEYKIYKLLYLSFVKRISYEQLNDSFNLLDKVYQSLNTDLQHLYLLITGKLMFENINQSQGLERLEKALHLKDSLWIKYRLGVAYSHNHQHLLATHLLEDALKSYEKSGRYINVLQCHNFLATCYKELGLYIRAEKHYTTLHTGAEFLDIPEEFFGIYTGLASLYLAKGDYHESLKWSDLAIKKGLPAANNKWTKAILNTENLPIAAAAYQVEACIQLKQIDRCNVLFQKYLNTQYEYTRYYKYLHFLKISIYNFNEESFYQEVTEEILPYYKEIGYLSIVRKIKIVLIEHLEKKRKYKEANKLYKELLK